MHPDSPGAPAPAPIPAPDDDFSSPSYPRGRVKSLAAEGPPPLHLVAGISPTAPKPTFDRRHPRRFTMGQKE
jgi:hypothetical protein